MEFSKLADGIVADPDLRRSIDKLLAIKRMSGEAEYGPSFPDVNVYIETEMQALGEVEPSRANATDAVLDRLLMETVLRFERKPS